MEAFLEDVTPSISFPTTHSARNDLLVQIHKVAAAYRGKSGKIVREMIALGQLDPTVIQSFVEGYLEPRRLAAKEVLIRGINNNEFSKRINIEVVVDSLYGPIFHRMLTKHAPIDDCFVDEYVSLILNAIAVDKA
ncbi:TetR-like C-terminal domain-containing protein [Obesumbacterium proteus]|uniref:TetR-like C-terminal domain-containing protein n=1 Tax=Obesumbacterium proteus TaxID=82983 RepID=UPI00242F1937|nr:TetR-like C-terminal domain-containing protein [Obesumbacterium proteus]